jgi:ABC-type branched-subunit amino acid transport system ATPase component/ABC-type branched-subunit amino acid transport system permease subunit
MTMPLATALFSQWTVQFALLGLATGALTALVALSLVIVHRVSGVLNFAAAALGSIGAFVCYSLRDDFGWPTPLAVATGLMVGVLLGLLTYVVMAVLRNTSLLSRLIATLALLSSAEALMLLLWSNQLSQPHSILPTRNLVLGGSVRIGEDRLILIGIALVLAVALWAVYSRSLFGLATTAVSENRRVAAIAGWAPARIELVNYLIAGFLAALAAILLAPIVTLNAAILSVTVLSALAAALVGRFSAFGATVGAALVIGVLQSELTLFQPDIASAWRVSTPSLTGLPQAVPLLIILVVAVASGRARPSRGESNARLPLPGNGRIAKVPLALAVVVGAVLVFSAPSYSNALMTTFGIGIIIASVIVVSGYAGQLSLCQYALAGFGAWAAARSASSLDVPFLIALLIGVVAATAVGVLVALPAIRTRGVTLAIVTLALSLVFSALIFDNPSLTGGFEGIVVKSPELVGYNVDPSLHPDRYAALMLVALVLVGLMVANLRRGATGRKMIAVRSNERAAAGLGINVIGIKIYAFAVGAGIAGLGGVLIAFQQSNVQFTSFDVFGSILLVQYGVIGGLGWVSGVVGGATAAPGALISEITNNVFPNLNNVDAWLAVLSGVGVIQLLRQSPDGLAALWATQARRFIRRIKRQSGQVPTPAPTGVTDSAAMPVELSRRGLALEVSNVSVGFGGVIAVDDVSFEVAPGEVVGLIGPNGAGKTTLLDVITGFTRQGSGSIVLDGTDVSQWSPERRARAGISRSWQSVELFEELTVGDNLRVAEDTRTPRFFVRDLFLPDHRNLSAFAESVVDDLGLRAVLDQRPVALSLGTIKLVGIARTIIANPGIVLLDEPAAGLDERERRELAEVIRQVADRHGIAVVVVEHDMALILNTCDRIVVLDFGQKIADASPDAVQSDERVIQAYLGVPSRVEPKPTSVKAPIGRPA